MAVSLALITVIRQGAQVKVTHHICIIKARIALWWSCRLIWLLRFKAFPSCLKLYP